MTKKISNKLKKQLIKCQYPKCNKEAEVRLGMNDPDSEMIPYCHECSKKVEVNTVMKIFEIKSNIKNETNNTTK